MLVSLIKLSNRKLIPLMLFFLCFSIKAQESIFLKETKSTLNLFLEGSLNQFKVKSNIGIFSVGTISTLWALEEDDRLFNHYRREKLKSHVKIIGDSGVVMNFPFFGMGLWYLGHKNSNTKLTVFAKEFLATVYISLFESAFLSFIPVHERPSSENLSKWETDLRGNSSWPSGHVIPYSALFWKTLQFYGPTYAVVPFVLAWFTGQQRVQDGKHYVSDVVSSFFFTGLASEGVRLASKYDGNHPFYKWAFESDLQLSLLRYKSGIGPLVTFKY